MGNPSFTVQGDGINISLSVYSKTDTDIGHTLEGSVIHFTPRRHMR